jgi:hypothetical protein
MCLIVVAIMIPWTVVLAGKMTIDACVMNEGPGYFRGNAKMIRMFIFIAYIQTHSFFATSYPTFIHATECLPYAKRNATFRPWLSSSYLRQNHAGMIDLQKHTNGSNNESSSDPTDDSASKSLD